jgi:hypothetical protein
MSEASSWSPLAYSPLTDDSLLGVGRFDESLGAKEDFGVRDDDVIEREAVFVRARV